MVGWPMQTLSSRCLRSAG
ncbi:hypothetical protein VCHE16_0721, partial [Vibrio paracholerae HE-16]